MTIFRSGRSSLPERLVAVAENNRDLTIFDTVGIFILQGRSILNLTTVSLLILNKRMAVFHVQENGRLNEHG